MTAKLIRDDRPTITTALADVVTAEESDHG